MEQRSESAEPRREFEVRVRPLPLARFEWLILSLLVLAGFVLAVAGARGSAWARLSTALELLYPHFPGAASAGTSSALMVARFLLPLVALYATARFIASFYVQKLRRLRVRRLRDHAIVCGLSESGVRAARTFAGQGRRVVAVDRDGYGGGAEVALSAGSVVMAANPTVPTVLEGAGVEQAARLVCALDDDAENVTIALRARQLAGAERLAIYARVRRELVELLDRSDVECFDLNDIWARNLLEAGPLGRPPRTDRPPLLIVVGSGPLAGALVANATRLWHFYARDTGTIAQLRVVFVGPEAADDCRRILARNPAATRTSSLESVSRDLSEPLDLAALAGQEQVVAVYLCSEDEALNAALARVAQRQLASLAAAEILIPAGALGGLDTDQLSDAPHGSPVLTAVGPDRVDGLRLERFGRREELARALHGVYLNHAQLLAGRPTVAVAPFDELSPEDQRRNRAQAEDIPRQLRAVLCRIVPITDWDNLTELNPDEVEVMAELEHLRWADARVRDAWRWGAERDDVGRRHPDLVPWKQLSEVAREISRALVRERPALLGRVGQGIERDPRRETLAAAVHSVHASQFGQPAEIPGWNALAEDERRPSRSLVASLPEALLAIGYRIDATDGRAGIGAFDSSEVESLSEAAHHAWGGARIAAGWAPAEKRDDERQLHPDLVPWQQLPEARRAIDRALITAVPDLLARHGLALERLDTDVWKQAGPDGSPEALGGRAAFSTGSRSHS